MCPTLVMERLNGSKGLERVKKLYAGTGSSCWRHSNGVKPLGDAPSQYHSDIFFWTAFKRPRQLQDWPLPQFGLGRGRSDWWSAWLPSTPAGRLAQLSSGHRAWKGNTKFSCRSRREAIFGAADLGYSCWASVALIWLIALATKSYHQPNRRAFWALGPRRTSRRPPATRDTTSSARRSGRAEKQLEEQHSPRVKNFTGKISVEAGGSHHASLVATKQSTIGVQRWRRA